MASKRAVRRRRCGHKIRYDSEAEAKAACWQVWRRRGGEQMLPYRCPACGHFHTGHAARWILKAIGRAA